MVAELHASSPPVTSAPRAITAAAPAVAAAAPATPEAAQGIIVTGHLDFSYGQRPALMDVNLTIPEHAVTAFIGPSGCGKSTLLRCFNRLNDRIPGARITAGSVRIMGKNISDPDVDLMSLRRQVGMIFQKYNPFPKSIYDNVVYPLRINGVKSRSELDTACERALRSAALWDEVKDRLKASAFGLSGGQMQRLCIARAVAVQPKILLMDEPCSALDPIATLKIEELIHTLKAEYTVVIVTHNMQQARRVADKVAFFYMGRLIEAGSVERIYFNPTEERTQHYVQGQFS
jgi:phosphate transport system ATP-binding protein